MQNFLFHIFQIWGDNKFNQDLLLELSSDIGVLDWFSGHWISQLGSWILFLGSVSFNFGFSGILAKRVLDLGAGFGFPEYWWFLYDQLVMIWFFLEY